jgi:hypothetical protein
MLGDVLSFGEVSNRHREYHSPKWVRILCPCLWQVVCTCYWSSCGSKQ